MIFVDPREGSRRLVAPQRAAGIEVDDSNQLAADVYFVGWGEKGTPINIGIEYKLLPDLIDSLKTERLQGHQLLEMRGVEEPGDRPEFDVAWLLIEGDITYTVDGAMIRRTGPRTFAPMFMNVDELFKRLNVMHLRAGLNYFVTKSKRDSVRWLTALYRTWTDVDLDKHKSHLAVYNAPTLLRPTKFRKVIGRLPNVGDRVCAAAEKQFGSIRRAVTAGAQEWADLTTVDEKGKSRRFGTSHAQKIVEYVS